MSDDEDCMPVRALLEAPTLNLRHIDGPLLSWAGRGHWLTLRERIALRFGRTTTEALAQKRWPDRLKWVEAQAFLEAARPTPAPAQGEG